MKVKNLIERLSTLDPELRVFVEASDGDDLVYSAEAYDAQVARLSEDEVDCYIIEEEEDQFEHLEQVILIS